MLHASRRIKFLRLLDYRSTSQRDGSGMKIFGQLVRTAINVVKLPAAVVKDVVTLGGIATEQGKPYTAQALTKLADEAQEETFLDDFLKKLGG